MSEEEILKMWYQGITRLKLAKIYRSRYNHNVQIIRLDMRNRHVRFITYKEALNRVEEIILKQNSKYNK